MDLVVAIQMLAEETQGDTVELPKQDVLHLIKRVRSAELEVSVACSQTVRLCADCVSAWCDSSLPMEELLKEKVQ